MVERLARPDDLGDTGSLALGGAMAGFAIMTRTEILLLVIGGLFVVITLSVMIEVLRPQGQSRQRPVPEHLQGPAVATACSG